MSIVAQSAIQELLIYCEALHSSKMHLWKNAMDKEVQALGENHIWNLIDPPEGTKILRRKRLYKLKYNMNGKIGRYKSRWVAKGFEQRESINFKETFSSVIKSCTTRTLLALAAFYSLSIEQMDSVTAYLNLEIDVMLYIKSLAGSTIIDKVCLLWKTIYGVKQSARQ